MTLMRKTTNQTSNFDHVAFEARTLDDAELNAVTGGTLSLSYEQIKFEYTEQGTASPAPPAKHWFNGG
jgi:type VI protein secretion system component Hcp